MVVVVNNQAVHLAVPAAAAVMEEATRVDLLQPAKAMRAVQAVQQLAAVVVVPGVLVQMHQVIIVVMVELDCHMTSQVAHNTMPEAVAAALILPDLEEPVVLVWVVMVEIALQEMVATVQLIQVQAVVRMAGLEDQLLATVAPVSSW